ncbi:MAG: argininosuccinate synthase [Actinobacteria bacterium]|nr:argininosuccinate synthase [Actinomycetota bacterium]MBU4241075.1 argininosuccinate synthase [Actinomycetota bacterium]MBU4489592.1 argininosuccinate synthase [Actinomycetota bacterium]
MREDDGVRLGVGVRRLDEKQGSKQREKVVLAYSGGLDTSVLVRWLIEERGLDVVALTVDLGQPGEMEEVRRKALATGAVDAKVVDAREMFVADYLTPAIWANALYQGEYPLATALARPLIAKLQVEEAHRQGASYIAHGCTGKGNDQVRFEVATAALDPSLSVIAPMREWKMTREEEIDYARKWGIPVPVTVESPYSVDENLWGRSCECGVLEDPWREPPEDAYEWTTSPEKAPDEPLYLEIRFEGGLPVGMDGEPMDLLDITRRLNDVGGEHGVGRIDVIEDRLVGIKSREIYEAPAAVLIIKAHRDLEQLTLTREALAGKRPLEQRVSEMAYEALWFSPLNRAIEAFNRTLQERVTGVVRLKLYKGRATVVGRRSPNSLYDLGLATYDAADAFDHNAARGFIELWGLPLKVWARSEKEAGGGTDE